MDENIKTPIQIQNSDSPSSHLINFEKEIEIAYSSTPSQINTNAVKEESQVETPMDTHNLSLNEITKDNNTISESDSIVKSNLNL